jgi:hypothetical protein
MIAAPAAITTAIAADRRRRTWLKVRPAAANDTAAAGRDYRSGDIIMIVVMGRPEHHM